MFWLRVDVGHLLGDRVPHSSSVCNRVVMPGLLRSGTNEAPMTWLEILGEIDNMLHAVDAHLLVARSVQFRTVEHAHEDDPVWKTLRRIISIRFRDKLLNPP